MDFDPSNMGGLGAMLGGLQQKAQEMKERLAATHVTGEAGGGLVKVTLSGDYQVQAVEIGEGAMDDRELLEDLVRAAMGSALVQVQQKMQENMSQLTGGLPIPPGLLPF